MMILPKNLRAMIVYPVIIVLGNLLLVQCSPFLTRERSDGSWDENMIDCSPGGRCWEMQHEQDLATRPEYYDDPLRLRYNKEQDSTMTRASSSGTASTNRLAKKDVFMSRGWGAGGMPFSVLYMNPHTVRTNSHSGMSDTEPARPVSLESPPTPTRARHPNYRLALRNGASGQPRRQYSTIPQLFVSYGWGPLGK